MDAFFELIVTEHQGAVFALLFSLLRDRELAEDLTQEVFLVLLRRIDEIDVSRPILPWLLKTARYVAANARRKQTLEHALFARGEEASRFWEQLGGSDLGADWRDRLAALRECRQRLPASQERVVDLHYNKGYAGARIAELVNAPVPAVHNRLSRARRALYDCIQRKLRRTHTP